MQTSCVEHLPSTRQKQQGGGYEMGLPHGLGRPFVCHVG